MSVYIGVYACVFTLCIVCFLFLFLIVLQFHTFTQWILVIFTNSFPKLILLPLLPEPFFRGISPPDPCFRFFSLHVAHGVSSPSGSLFSGAGAFVTTQLKKMTLLAVSSTSGEASGASPHLWLNVDGPSLCRSYKFPIAYFIILSNSRIPSSTIILYIWL